MTIASEITRINNNIAAAYTACNNKGATIPQTQNSANLANCIGSISTGSTPTLITKSITANGTYNASSDSADGYSSVTVNVSGGGSSKFGLTVDSFIGNVSNGVLSAPSTINGITFTGITEIGSQALESLFFYRRLVSGTVSFPSLTTVGYLGLENAFHGNQITSVDLSALTTVEDNGLSFTFDENEITSVDLSALTTVGYYGLYHTFSDNQITSVDLSALTSVEENGLFESFYNNQITSVDLSALTTVGYFGLYYAFYGNQITSVNLPSLTSIDDYGLAYAFGFQVDSEYVTTLTSISFPALTSESFGDYDTQFNCMLENCEDVTVHFPSNLEAVIGDWQDVLDGFNGINTTVLFDLAATE